jgi:hypothetical protein
MGNNSFFIIGNILAYYERKLYGTRKSPPDMTNPDVIEKPLPIALDLIKTDRARGLLCSVRFTSTLRAG